MRWYYIKQCHIIRNLAQTGFKLLHLSGFEFIYVLIYINVVTLSKPSRFYPNARKTFWMGFEISTEKLLYLLMQQVQNGFCKMTCRKYGQT